ncbi:MAG: hypothetical protein WBG14_11575, partial [Rhodococcus sp. (in: high G+C Gram-positive bacteria)]
MSQKSIARSRRTRLAAAGAAIALSVAVAGPGTALAQDNEAPSGTSVEQQPATESTAPSDGPAENGEGSTGDGAGVEAGSAIGAEGEITAPNPIVTEGGEAAIPAPSTQLPLPHVTGGVVVNADGSV